MVIDFHTEMRDEMATQEYVVFFIKDKTASDYLLSQEYLKYISLFHVIREDFILRFSLKL